jgi:hypothetical protein
MGGVLFATLYHPSAFIYGAIGIGIIGKKWIKLRGIIKS